MNTKDIIIAGAAAGNCLLGVVGTFTRSACVPTNAGVLANSDRESRKDSVGCWRNSVVGIAEPDMKIDNLMVQQKDLVKLHSRARNEFCHAVEVWVADRQSQPRDRAGTGWP